MLTADGVGGKTHPRTWASTERTIVRVTIVGDKANKESDSAPAAVAANVGWEWISSTRKKKKY